MPTGKRKKSWVLTDTAHRVWVDSLEVDTKDLGVRGFPEAAFRKYTLRGGPGDGVDIVEVNNGALSFIVLPTRGMGIWKGDYKGNLLGWNSPLAGPVNPKFVRLSDRGGLGWLGGFDEWIVRCGLESNGAPSTDVLLNNMGQPAPVELSLHGRIANIPAHYVQVRLVEGDPPELSVSGIVNEAMLFCPQLRLATEITTRIGSNSLTIADEITNMRATPCEMELVYHCNYGEPFLEKGSRLQVPASETAPRDALAAEDVGTWAEYKGPTTGYTEQCYWHVPLADAGGNSVALLENAARDKGVVVRFKVGQLPCFSQWKNTAAKSDGYVTGLEPGTNFPNTRTFERKRGRVVKLPPGGRYRADLTFEVCGNAKGVRKVEREIEAIQKRQPREVHRQPQAKFSPLD